MKYVKVVCIFETKNVKLYKQCVYLMEKVL